MEQRLAHRVDERNRELIDYPLPMPYGIAETTKGYGFYGAGSNAAHNLPLPASPALDAQARELFNQHAAALWVEPQTLSDACNLFASRKGRVLERDNPLALRQPPQAVQPPLHFHDHACSLYNGHYCWLGPRWCRGYCRIVDVWPDFPLYHSSSTPAACQGT